MQKPVLNSRENAVPCPVSVLSVQFSDLKKWWVGTGNTVIGSWFHQYRSDSVLVPIQKLTSTDGTDITFRYHYYIQVPTLGLGIDIRDRYQPSIKLEGWLVDTNSI